MDESFAVFDKYCRSETTKKNYRYFFSKFFEWCKVNIDQMITSEGLLALKESYLQEIVENYIYSLRNKVGPNSYSGTVASIQLFCSMNDKILNWDKINRLIPASTAKSGKEAWTNNDIRKMLASTTSLRNKAIIHFLASTGCRLGAIPHLRLKDIENMPDNCKAVLIYAGSKEEYYGFLTAEASRVLDDYIEKRKKDGEDVNCESFAFREEYRLGIEKPKALSHDAFALVLHRIIKKIERKRTGKRFNVQRAHGFRKRFASTAKMDNKISWAVSERLLGHKSYLDEEYFRPTKENLFFEFKKVMADLTISDEERVKAENMKLKQEKSELEKSRIEIDEMKKRLEDIECDKKARYSSFARNMLSCDAKNDLKGKLFSMLFYVMFEMNAPEEEKRRIWKELFLFGQKGKIIDPSSFMKPENFKLENLFDRPVSVVWHGPIFEKSRKK